MSSSRSGDVRRRVQKRQKLSTHDEDEKCKGEDKSDVYGGIPSHLLELVCRLVVRALAKRLPEKYEQLVELSAATGLCNDDDVARLRDSCGCRQPLLTIYNSSGNQWFSHQSYNMAGTQIVTAKSNNAHILDAKTGQIIQSLNGHEGAIFSASFNPRGTLIGTSSFDETCRIWSVRTGKCIRIIRGHSNVTVCASFSNDGRWIVTASADGTARIWSVRTGDCAQVLQHDRIVNFLHAVYSPDDSMILTVQRENQKGYEAAADCNMSDAASVWDAGTGECKHILKGHIHNVTFASFSPDKNLIATASRDKTVRIWRVDTGECIHVLQGHESRVNSAVFSPDSAHIVTASYDGTFRIWNVADGRQLFQYDISEAYGIVYSASYDATGTRIIARTNSDRLGFTQIMSAPVFRFK